MAVYIVLLRAIGPVTHKLMTMKQLELACRKAGLSTTRNLLATGNLVVATDWPAARIQRTIETIVRDAGIVTTVFVRPHANLADIVAANPLAEVARSRPSQYQVVFLDHEPSDSALDTLRARARTEHIERIRSDICIDYRGGISDSKLTPALVERILGSTSTARNWNTTLKILALADEMAGSG
jgi:uncharacterized protein (DUF1697 family)